eukprot:1383049-Rhodomonas_salina.1
MREQLCASFRGSCGSFGWIVGAERRIRLRVGAYGPSVGWRKEIAMHKSAVTVDASSHAHAVINHQKTGARLFVHDLTATDVLCQADWREGLCIKC